MKLFLKSLTVALLLGTGLIFGGCANYLQPELGAIAREDSAILLEKLGAEQYTLKTEDITLVFSTVNNGDILELSGNVIFSSRLVNTFNRAQIFNLKMSFLDDQRMVLGIVDISPMFAFGAEIPDKVKFKARAQILPGSKAIAFNYYGVFDGDTPSMGNSEVFHFPFE